MGPHTLISLAEITAILEGVSSLAEQGGLWTPEAAAVIKALALMLDVDPKMPKPNQIVILGQMVDREYQIQD